MEVNIRTTAADYRLNVPVGGELTFHINPVGGLVPQIDRRLYVNGARVYPQASGGFTIKINPVALLVPPQAGGVKEEYESENPKLPYMYEYEQSGKLDRLSICTNPSSQKPLEGSDPSPGKANPKVFFDMTVCGKPVGRIVMELFADTTPRTAENFRALCTGEKGMGKMGKPLHYKGSIIYHMCPGYMIAGGDIINGGKGNGGESIYGSRFFEDENFIKRHSCPGILSMNNGGPDTNGSEFMICLRECPELDDEHVVFGQVVEGLDVVSIISVQRIRGMPSRPVVIADCGQIS